MNSISITRRYPRTNRVETPHRYRGGFYKVADPAFGDDKKKTEFEIRVCTIGEVLKFTRRGFHVRMSGGSGHGSPSLISPDNLVVRVSRVEG